MAFFLFGVFVSIVPIITELFTGVSVTQLAMLALGILLAAFCFSSMAAVLSAPPTDVPANVTMPSTLIKLPLVFNSGVFLTLAVVPHKRNVPKRL